MVMVMVMVMVMGLSFSHYLVPKCRNETSLLGMLADQLAQDQWPVTRPGTVTCGALAAAGTARTGFLLLQVDGRNFGGADDMISASRTALIPLSRKPEACCCCLLLLLLQAAAAIDDSNDNGDGGASDGEEAPPQ
jgi:hypothetical protein